MFPSANGFRCFPALYRRFLVAVGLFGAGDFAHTLLILLATQKLGPTLGATKATSVAVALYVLHNVFYAGFASDRSEAGAGCDKAGAELITLRVCRN